MPENRTTNAQTLVIESNIFQFESLQEVNGHATVVKFKLENPQIIPGDVLLVLDGSEVQFHGMIGKIEGNFAIASDPHGSLLPAWQN
jgi:hypothetical protein